MCVFMLCEERFGRGTPSCLLWLLVAGGCMVDIEKGGERFPHQINRKLR